MEINVNHQNAGVINYSENQVINGGLHGTVVTDQDAWRAVRELQQALTGIALDETRAAEARAQIAEIGAAVRTPQPDKRRVASTLERLTKLLTNAGSLATAGAALTGPLQTLTTWLGAHGAAILSMLAL